MRAARESLEQIAAATDGLVALVGTPWFDRDLANACAVCADGRVRAVYRKHFLPNYGVFDEHRYFAEGRDLVVLQLGEASRRHRRSARTSGSPARPRPISRSPERSSSSTSPRRRSTSARPRSARRCSSRERATRARYFAFCNLVGGQDELVFDGHSVVLDDAGEVVARAPGFEEHLLVVDIEPPTPSGGACATCGGASSIARARQRSAVEVVELGAAARAAERLDAGDDRRRSSRSSSRCGWRSRSASATTSRRTASREVVVGVSGGIDSAVTAALCATRSGRSASTASRCRRGTRSEGTRSDARRVAESLGCDVPRDPDRADRRRVPRRARGEIDGGLAGLAAENLQARVRGVLLMALSNTYGWLVVSTGNKSELAVGYSTLYGDMVGGFALLKDVFKTDVFRLAEHLNERAGRELIPRSDDRARAERRAPRRPARRGLAPAVRRARPGARGVRRARPLARGAARRSSTRASSSARVALVDRAEYKRRQAPPGVKLRPKAFGRDRRTPITNRWG